ncbi:glycosyltransferase, partial [bacterium]|nr:glycosyltransferase [bacterium]
MNNGSSPRSRDTIVSVFIPYWPTNPYQEELAKSLESHGVKVEKGDSLKSVFRDIIFRHYRPDILHLHWLPWFEWRITSFLRLSLFVLRLFVVHFLGIKLVWTVHNLRPHESKCPKVDWLVRILITRLTNTLITHTKWAKQQVVSTWRLRHSQKVLIIPHGNYIDCYENKIDQTTARKRLCICNSKLVILFLGEIKPYKGVLQLIDTFKLLGQERTHLVIAGRPLNDELTSAIRKKIQGCNNIKFAPGFVADDQIQVFMNASDIVVFPYRTILTSGAVILAMSFGRPCIAPRIGCISDILDEEGSFLYDSDDDEGLLKAMNL